jgi:hypothetical protein
MESDAQWLKTFERGLAQNSRRSRQMHQYSAEAWKFPGSGINRGEYYRPAGTRHPSHPPVALKGRTSETRLVLFQ